VVHGNADSDAVKDLGKPGAGESHARFDERGLETEHGLGTAAPATCAWTAPDLSATAPALDSDITLLYQAAGSDAVYTGSRLEQCFRDAHVMTQHVAGSTNRYEQLGRFLMG